MTREEIPLGEEGQSFRVIVCEMTGDWAAALRRGSKNGLRLRISETRSYPACLRELAIAPSAAVVLELRREKLREGLRTLSAISQQYPLARILAVAARELRPLEWGARELGAVHFETSPRDPAALVEVLGKSVRECGSAQMRQ